MHVASKILKSFLHNMKYILVNCHVVMSINLIFLEKCENWVNWKQQNEMKTLLPKFDFHRIYSFMIDDDSDKIWTFSETDHTHFFTPKVRFFSLIFKTEYGVNRLKGQSGTRFKSKNSWTTYKILIFIMFWASI